MQPGVIAAFDTSSNSTHHMYRSVCTMYKALCRNCESTVLAHCMSVLLLYLLLCCAALWPSLKKLHIGEIQMHYQSKNKAQKERQASTIAWKHERVMWSCVHQVYYLWVWSTAAARLSEAMYMIGCNCTTDCCSPPLCSNSAESCSRRDCLLLIDCCCCFTH
jgi:hypothetical protein